MKTKNHGPSIKDDKAYEELRDQGYSKEKSARIANSDKHKAGKKGGSHSPYEEWTKEELYEQAQLVEIEGRADMTKEELIEALRNH